MRTESRRGSRVLLGLGLAATCWGAAPGDGHAFTTDARRMGMGGVQVPGSRELSGQNVAYQSMPSRHRDHGFVIPLPLGLLQLATDFPTFDPNDSTFSVTRLANLAGSPPFFLELKKPQELNGDISLTIARNSFQIDFEDAQKLLPQKPLDIGSIYARPLFGMGVLGARTYVSPLVTLQGDVQFDDAMYGVLSQGKPLLPNSTYRMNAGGETMGGAAFNLGYSDGLSVDPEGNGLYAGAYAKYLMGFGFGQAASEFSLTTRDTIFGNGNPLQVDYDATTRTSRFGRIGNGVGFDAGVAYRVGALDFGVGLRDIGSSVHWTGVEHKHTQMDSTGALVTQTVSSDESYTSHLPTQTTLNAAWSGERTTLAADLTTSSWSTGVHFGAERRLGMMAVRGGILTDNRSQTQYAWGLGVGLSRLWLDLGFQTHSYTVTGERGVTLATSFAIR